MSKPESSVHDSLASREKEIFKTLDIFSHGVNSGKGKSIHDENLGVTETSHQDIQITLTQTHTTDEKKHEDEVNGNTQQWIHDSTNENDHSWDQISKHDMVCLQTGSKLYHGDDGCLEKTTEDEVEESILSFLKIPSDCKDQSESSKALTILKEVECYIWHPDDDRRNICKDALEFLRKGVESRGIKIKEHHVDLSKYNLDFPVVIICLPPQKPQKISIGDMPVALILIHQSPPIAGNKDTPLSDDLYWRRYKNLSIILDIQAKSDSFGNSKMNKNSINLLSEFLHPS